MCSLTIGKKFPLKKVNKQAFFVNSQLGWIKFWASDYYLSLLINGLLTFFFLEAQSAPKNFSYILLPLIKLLQLLFALAYRNQCYFPIFICLFLGKFRTKRDDKSSRFVLNSRWHLSKCILSVHSMFLDSKWAISSSQNMRIVPPFSTVLPKQLNLIARTSQSPSLFLAIPPYYWHCFWILQTSSKLGQC